MRLIVTINPKDEPRASSLPHPHCTDAVYAPRSRRMMHGVPGDHREGPMIEDC